MEDSEILKEKIGIFEKFGFKFKFENENENDEIYLIETGKIGKQTLDESDLAEMIFSLSQGIRYP